MENTAQLNTTTIQKVLENHPNESRDSLIPILQEVQDECGFLSEEAIVEVGRHLKLPTSKIYGVATFYNQFRFSPPGKYNVQICRGTACHVLGSATVLEELERILGIKSGQTTKDGMFSIEVVACIGACGLAPVVAVNGNFHAKITPEKIEDLVIAYRNKETPNND